MNIYDPADLICYVHLAGEADAGSSPAGDGLPCSTLPPGYANQSPRTRLPHRPPRSRGDQRQAAPVTA